MAGRSRSMETRSIVLWLQVAGAMLVVGGSGWMVMLGIDDWLWRGTTAMNADIELLVFVVIRGTHLNEARFSPDGTRLSNYRFFRIAVEARLPTVAGHDPRLIGDNVEGSSHQFAILIFNKIFLHKEYERE